MERGACLVRDGADAPSAMDQCSVRIRWWPEVRIAIALRPQISPMKLDEWKMKINEPPFYKPV